MYLYYSRIFWGGIEVDSPIKVQSEIFHKSFFVIAEPIVDTPLADNSLIYFRIFSSKRRPVHFNVTVRKRGYAAGNGRLCQRPAKGRYKAPVVIDTPMARLDSSHRANFVTKYLPAASSQVIVLSTDEEVYGRYLDLIRDNVVDYYTLLYREEDQCTSIIHGYFGEV